MTPPRMEPVTLTGRLVRLEPLRLDHVPGLAEVGLDPAIWQWTIARPTSEADLRTWASALLGLGASFEGVFRNHMVMPDGPMRHSAYYSVIDDEWPAIKARLEGLIRA